MTTTPTPEAIAAALIDDEVLQAGLSALCLDDPVREDTDAILVRGVFVAMMSVLLRRETAE